MGGVIGSLATPRWGASGSMDMRALIDGVGDPKGDDGRLQTAPAVMGTRISNSDPFLGPETCERKQKRSPPSFLARPFATSSPKPRPSLCRVVESSSQEKGLNKFGRKAAGIPDPVSLTLITT